MGSRRNSTPIGLNLLEIEIKFLVRNDVFPRKIYIRSLMRHKNAFKHQDYFFVE